MMLLGCNEGQSVLEKELLGSQQSLVDVALSPPCSPEENRNREATVD
jgi:hypothetical protein